MKNIKSIFLACALVIATPLHSQYLGVHAFQLPALGFMSMESFQVTPQATFGLGYSQLLATNLWGLVNTAIGYGKTIADGDKSTRLGTAQGQLGLKYNFLSENWRPFFGTYVQYLHLLGPPVSDDNGNLLAVSFVGLRPSIGLEWFVWSDMSLEAEAGYVLYFNLDDPWQHGAQAKIAYNLYF